MEITKAEKKKCAYADVNKFYVRFMRLWYSQSAKVCIIGYALNISCIAWYYVMMGIHGQSNVKFAQSPPQCCVPMFAGEQQHKCFRFGQTL